MAMQSYGTAPGRNTAVAAGPPRKGLIESAMRQPMTPAPKPKKLRKNRGRKKMPDKYKGNRK